MTRWTPTAISLAILSAIFAMIDPVYLLVIAGLIALGAVAFGLLWVFDAEFRSMIGEVRHK